MNLRKATLTDVEVTFKWQVNPLVRQYSRNVSAPSYATHLQWFTNSLKDKHRQIWIFEVMGEPVGQLRMDKGDRNEVSILISPEHTGKGYGKGSLKLLCEYYSGINLWAYIKPENTASIDIFCKNDFIHQHDNWYLLATNTNIIGNELIT